MEKRGATCDYLKRVTGVPSAAATSARLQTVAQGFQLCGVYRRAQAHGRGHINDTFVVDTDDGGKRIRYLLQRINSFVFPDPLAVMENIGRITRHLARRADHNGQHESGLTHLTLVPTIHGADFLCDQQSQYWRVFDFIEDSYSIETTPSARAAKKAAAAFGYFQHALADLPPPPLRETIPGFHDTRERYRQFDAALGDDLIGRAKACAPEIELALQYREGCGVLLDLLERGEAPVRVTHNDTKINNVLFDRRNHAAKCVVDLDTVMHGSVLFDFGDLVRSAAISGVEDDSDVSNVALRLDLFSAIAEGYLSATRHFLNTAELDHLAIAGRVLAVETGLRFLTDYLSGDRYFRTARPDHNLDRCRTQFALVTSIDEQLDAMRARIRDAAESGTRLDPQ